MVRLTYALVCALCLLFTVASPVARRGRNPVRSFRRRTNITCSAYGRTFQDKEHYDIPGQCSRNVCMGENIWSLNPCDDVGTPFGWTLIPDDPTKPYPQCCAHAVPPQSIFQDLVDEIQWNDIQEESYDSGGVNEELRNEQPPTQVRSQPEVNYAVEPTGWYMLVMVDPDTLSIKDSTVMLHWILGNILGDDVSNGEIVADHVGSESPQRRGFHRYLILLYKQHGKLTFEDPIVSNTTENRHKFSIQDFAEKYELSNPVALKLYQG
ncbi:uncharacterized protein LOC124353776 [Homalodisca vitripennis]|uniref:uncharacterized protein LOC124353776 n=1 Tax=Homalodisca vitripennis TaxID=197043 RepID=UPI001EEAB88E|nr:uncharacterized protein LOC124353776 [Homalodisca vitripennis]